MDYSVGALHAHFKLDDTGNVLSISTDDIPLPYGHVPAMDPIIAYNPSASQEQAKEFIDQLAAFLGLS